ncbi:hypothetical protein LDENG_00039100 [Lucifuga dentata]|nr:hypothetical protein LDENG_00039100 [Lucifuga dentata]
MPSFGFKGPKVEGPEVDIDVKTPEVDLEGPDLKIKTPKFKMPHISGPKMPDLDFKLKGPQVKGDVPLPKIEGDIKGPKMDIEGPDVDIEGEKSGFKMPKFKMPSFSMKGPDWKGPDIDVNLPKSEVDIKAPVVDIESPSGKIKGPKFKMPSILGPNISMPDIDFKGPKLKGDIDLDLPVPKCPEIEGDIKTPEIGIKGPEIDIEGPKGGFEMPKIKMPSFGFKGPKVEGPEVDIDVKAPEVDLEGPDLKIKTPKFKMPHISGPKMPDLDFKLKGPQVKGDVPLPKIEGDIKGPKMDIEGPDVDIESEKSGFKLPKFKMPSFSVKGPDWKGPDIDVNLPKSEVGIKAPDVDIESPSGKIKGPKFKMPSLSGPNISMPDIDFKGPKLKGDIDLDLPVPKCPEIEGDIKTPEIGIKGPEIDIEGPKGGFEMPKIKMPSFGFKGPKVEGPEVDIDVKAPEVDLEGPDLKIKTPKFKMPHISGPKMPDLDFKLKGPQVKGDVPLPKIEGDIKGPKMDIEGPDVDIEGEKSGFKMPKFKMPSFSVKGPDWKGPDIDVNLPKSEVDIKAPDVDIESPSGKIKGPKFKMPSISGPNISMSDIDFKGPKLKGDVDLDLSPSVPKIEGDIKIPEIDIKGPEIDIEGPKGGFEMPKIKMPSFGFKGAKVEGPDVDMNLPEFDIDVTVPEADLEGPDLKIKTPKFKMPHISGPKMPDLDFKLKGPQVKGDVPLPKIEGDIKGPKMDFEGPDVDIEGEKSGFKMLKFKMPTVSMKGPDWKGPDIDVNLPKSEVDIKAPDVDIESPSGKIKGPKFKMPSISGPNISMPDIDFKGPKLKGDIDLDLSVPKCPEIEGDIKTPEIGIKGPEIDIEGPKGGFEMPKIKMPSFGFKGPKVEGPDVGMNIPEVDIDVKAPEVDLEGPDLKIKTPKFKMPHISGPKMPDLDFKLKGPQVKGDVSLPKIEGDIKVAKMDIEGPDVEIEGDKSGFKMLKFKMPSFDMAGSDVKCPEIDVNLPKADIDIKAPEVDIKSSDIDIESPSSMIRGSKFKLPSFSGPKISMPDVGFSLKGPTLKDNLDVTVPNVEGEIHTSDIGFKGPKVDLQGPKGGIEFPKIKMPSFGIIGPKVEGPDVDVNLLKPDMDVKAPQVDVKLPDVDVEGPDLKFESPEGHLKPGKVKFPTLSGPKISFPDVDFKLKGPKVKSDVEGYVTLPKAKIEGQDVTVDIPESGSKTKFKIPKFGFKVPRVKAPETDVQLVQGDVNIKGPRSSSEGLELDLGMAGPKTKGSKFKMPKFGFKSPKAEMPEVDVNSSQAGIDITLPDVDIKGPKILTESPSGKIGGAKLKMPSMSGPKISVPHVDFNLTTLKDEVDVSVPTFEGDISAPKVGIRGPTVDIEGPKTGFEILSPKAEGPDVDINLPKPDIDVKVPEVDIKVPEVEGPDIMIKGPEFKMPSISGSEVPDLDIKFKGPQLEGGMDMSVPKIEGDISAPEVDITGPDVDIKGPEGGFEIPKFKIPSIGLKGLNGQGSEVDVSLPKAELSVKAAGMDIDSPHAPQIEGDIKASEVNIDMSTDGLQMPKIKMPSIGVQVPKVEGPDVDINLPKTDTDIKPSEFEVGIPGFHIEGPDGKIHGPKVKMPSMSGLKKPDMDINLKSPELKGAMDLSAPSIQADKKAASVDIEGPQFDVGYPEGLNLEGGEDVSLPKVEGDLKGPEIPKDGLKITAPGFQGSSIQGPVIDISCPKADFDIKSPEIKGQDLDVEGLKIEVPSISGPKISMPGLDKNLKWPQIKGEGDASILKLEGDIKGPNINITAPTINVEGVSTDTETPGVTFPKFKGPKFGIRSPKLEGSESMAKTPMFSVSEKVPKADISLPDAETSLDAPDIDFSVKGKKGKFKLPKVKGKANKADVDIETPGEELDVDAPNIHVKGAKGKKPIFGKLHFPDVELDIKSPMVKGDGSLSEDLKSQNSGLPSATLNTNTEASGTGQNVSLEGSDVKLKSPNIEMPNVKGGVEIDSSMSVGSAIGSIHYPEGTVTFPKIKVPKFGIALPDLGGEKVESEPAATGGINIQSPSIEVPSPELKQSEEKIKVKMPKFFGKTKGKASISGDLQGPEVELGTSEKGGKVSKDQSLGTGKLVSGKLEFEGVSVSPKGKSASLDLFKKSRHRSSSLSDEGGLALSSPSAHLEAEGGDISLDLGGAKAKGKKGKLKFGTFGGFGSKSKGSYEVTLGEDSEAAAEGGVKNYGFQKRMSVSGKKEFDVKQILRLRWRWFSHSSQGSAGSGGVGVGGVGGYIQQDGLDHRGTPVQGRLKNHSRERGVGGGGLRKNNSPVHNILAPTPGPTPVYVRAGHQSWSHQQNTIQGLQVNGGPLKSSSSPGTTRKEVTSSDQENVKSSTKEPAEVEARERYEHNVTWRHRLLSLCMMNLESVETRL